MRRIKTKVLEPGANNYVLRTVGGVAVWVPHDASSIPVTPVGDVAATDVQAAIAELDAEKAPVGHAHETGKFKGEWVQPEDDLIFSHDFSTGVSPFTGEGMQTTMANAIGTSKPAYSHVDQFGANINGGTRTVAQLDLATLSETSGRTLTRLVVWHSRRVVHSSSASREAAFDLLQNGVVEWTESIPVAGSQTVDRAWATEIIDNPTGVFVARFRNVTGHTTSTPTATMAVTGFELYATPLTGSGYDAGEFVTHGERLWRSTVDGNVSEPTDAEPTWVYVPLGRARTLHTGTQPASTITGLAAVATSGSATDITIGTLPNSVLPPLAITDTTPVATEAEMLALAAQVGDVAVRTDLNTSFILAAEPASTLANWQELLSPSGAVSSVDGRTGVVTLTDLYAALAHGHAATEVTYAGSTDLTATNVEGALDELDAEKAPTAHLHGASSVSFTPYGKIEATNVERAVQELEDEKMPSTVQVGGANLIDNSSFEYGSTLDFIGVDMWTVSVNAGNPIRSTGQGSIQGKSSLRWKALAAGESRIRMANPYLVQLQGGETVALSAYVRPEGVARTMRIKAFTWSDAAPVDNTTILDNSLDGPEVVCPADVWTRITAVVTVDPAAKSLSLAVSAMDAGVDQFFNVEAVQAELGEIVTGYAPRVVNDSSVIRAGAIIQPFNPFGAEQIYIADIHNALFFADKRFTVTATRHLQSDDSLVLTANASNLFDSSYDSTLAIPAGEYLKVLVDLGGSWPGYGYGDLLVNTYNARPLWGGGVRVYSNFSGHGIGWHDLDFIPAVSDNSLGYMWKASQTKHQISQIEYTLLGPPAGSTEVTWVGALEWNLNRGALNVHAMPYVTKYAVNTLYDDFSWVNSSGVETLRMGAGGITKHPQASWSSAPLVNGWSDYGSGHRNANYAKDALGFVHLRGLLSASGATSNNIFTLPTGLRPSASEIFLQKSSANALYTEVRVLSTGVVQVSGTRPDTWLSLAGITFEANQ